MNKLTKIVLLGLAISCVGCAAESVKAPARIRAFSGGRVIGEWKTDKRPVRWGPAVHFRDATSGREIRLLPGVIID